MISVRRIALIAAFLSPLLGGCGGGGGAPSAPDENLTAADIFGIWNVSYNVRSNSCDFLDELDAFQEAWEIFPAGSQPQFAEPSSDLILRIVFNPSTGEVLASGSGIDNAGDPFSVLVEAELTSRTRLSGTVQLTAVDFDDSACLARWAITGRKFSDVPGPGPGPVDTAGSITGRVTDESGAGIVGASVGTTPGTSIALTAANGNYRIDDVAAGSYAVTASKEGFSSASVTVNVTSGASVTAPTILLTRR